MHRLDREALKGDLEPYYQEGEDPRIAKRVGMTIFGHLKSNMNATQKLPKIPGAFMRERGSIVLPNMSWKERTEVSRLLAPSAEYTTLDEHDTTSDIDAIAEAVERQLGIQIVDWQSRIHKLFENDYKGGAISRPYRSSHYGLLIKRESDLRRLLESIRLPINAGNLIHVSKKGAEKIYDDEVSAILDSGFARFEK